ncbi:alpha/beta hydrolase [Metabacillus indicus]|uniref:alpha/beta fold hydrolase n=1 Tax=Metabacillus indicus TaxID=246786 RepID=UPI00318122C7
MLHILYYRTLKLHEKKPWVTFIHGAGGSSSIWYKQIREFKKHFNILLIDLRGHGRSAKGMWKEGDDFSDIAEEVIDVHDRLKISSSHFVGISLGTIVIQTIAKIRPGLLSSMVLGGAITKLNVFTRMLLVVGNLGKRILPYMWLYSLFAWIIMPYATHKESRTMFISQAKKMCQKEFIQWFSLTRFVNPYLIELQKDFHKIPVLFLMGEQDHLFLKPVKEIASENKDVQAVYIADSGHVCNIDQPDKFNHLAVSFIKKIEADRFSVRIKNA